MITPLPRIARGHRAGPEAHAFFAAVPAFSLVLLVPLVLAAACTQESANKPQSATPAEQPAVVRRPIPEPDNAPHPEPSPIAPLSPAETTVVVPPGTQYVCVTNAAGERRQTAIEFSPQVAQLCIRNPEMGPCQYERNACRRIGGRVFGADGKEITLAIEAEYDKKVTRIKLKSN